MCNVYGSIHRKECRKQTRDPSNNEGCARCEHACSQRREKRKPVRVCFPEHGARCAGEYSEVSTLQQQQKQIDQYGRYHTPLFIAFALAGPFAAVSPQEALWSDKKALSSLTSSQELFSSLEEEQLQVMSSLGA